MDTIRQEHEDESSSWIDDYRGSGKPGMSIALRRREAAHVVRGIQLPSQAPVPEMADLVASHLGHGSGIEQLDTGIRTAVEMGLAEDGEVLSGTKETGVAGDTTQEPGILIVDLPSHHASSDG